MLHSFVIRGVDVVDVSAPRAELYRIKCCASNYNMLKLEHDTNNDKIYTSKNRNRVYCNSIPTGARSRHVTMAPL